MVKYSVVFLDNKVIKCIEPGAIPGSIHYRINNVF